MSTQEQREAAARFFLKDTTNNVRDWIETGHDTLVDEDVEDLADLLAVREATLTRRADTITITVDELRQLQGIATPGGTGELEVPWRTDEARSFVEQLEAEVVTLQEQVATLTAERDHFRKRLVETDTEASEARADNARHLETIRALQSAVVEVCGLSNAAMYLALPTLRAALDASKHFDVKDGEG